MRISGWSSDVCSSDLILSLAMQLFLGVSANDIRRWTLERQGYRDIGVAAGRTLEEAERDFFRRWTGHALTVAPTLSASAPVWPHRPEEHQPLGLFPRAGRSDTRRGGKECDRKG